MAKKALLTVMMRVDLPDDFPNERVGKLCLSLDILDVSVDSIDEGFVQGARVAGYETIDVGLEHPDDDEED